MGKKSINSAYICGIVSENGLEKGSYVKKVNGVDVNVNCIRGDLKVRVTQPLVKGGELVTLEIPVKFFSNELTAKGTPNPSYTSLMEAMDKIQSIAQVGEEKATWVRLNIKEGAIKMNEYYKNDVLVSYPQVNGSFINTIVPTPEIVQEARFSVQMYVNSAKDETEADGTETGRYIVKGILIGWDESADVMEFVVTNPKAIEYMRDNWTPGTTVDASGLLNFSTTTKTVEVPQEFGDPIYQTKTTRVSELLITSGSAPKDGDYAFTEDEIIAAGEKRKERLAALKNKTKGTQTGAASAPTLSDRVKALGF